MIKRKTRIAFIYPKRKKQQPVSKWLVYDKTTGNIVYDTVSARLISAEITV